MLRPVSRPTVLRAGLRFSASHLDAQKGCRNRRCARQALLPGSGCPARRILGFTRSLAA
jgi:hypothetical protein